MESKNNIGIITINDFSNLGNRLQNYALQETLKKIGFNPITIRNDSYLNTKKGFCYNLCKKIAKKILRRNPTKTERDTKFEEFNKNIIFSKTMINPYLFNTKKYKYFIVGSDQVWNPNFNRLSEIDLLTFAEPEKRIAFSASFGVNEVESRYISKARKELKKFKAISVRENRGKELVKEIADVESTVLVDPTMLLDIDEWDKVSKKPKQLHTDRYILNYFLGEISPERHEEINRIAKENNCEVIHIMDTKSEFHLTGPSEFLYLEKHAFLICTDSFHSCVFAILYNRPFLVFSREDINKSMNSRLDTLLNKFELINQKCDNNQVTENQLKIDFSETKKIIEIEKNKAYEFLKNNLN